MLNYCFCRNLWRKMMGIKKALRYFDYIEIWCVVCLFVYKIQQKTYKLTFVFGGYIKKCLVVSLMK